MPVFDEHFPIFHVYNMVSGNVLFHEIHNNNKLSILFFLLFSFCYYFGNEQMEMKATVLHCASSAVAQWKMFTEGYECLPYLLPYFVNWKFGLVPITHVYNKKIKKIKKN